MKLTRRVFLARAATGTAALSTGLLRAAAPTPAAPRLTVADLPVGGAPAPVALPHFPTRLHAYVWRNWHLVPLPRLARVVDATPAQLREIATSLGLGAPPRITRSQEKRSALTVIRRNWHLLPYEQLLALLEWTPDQMAYALREDDFLYVKLGNLKPRCAALRYQAPSPAEQTRAAAIARQVRDQFAAGVGSGSDPLFGFVADLSKPPGHTRAAGAPRSMQFAPRYCSSYFALYGDPLLEPEADPYPDGYLARLAEAGVDGVWLQAVLYKLSPFPWQPDLSVRYEERRANLRRLVERARRHGIGIWLYLNEPRAMPTRFYAAHPDLKGVAEGDYAALCTSAPAVQTYLRDAVAGLVEAVPGLAGFFTISGSENLTNCWSHGQGRTCPRCAARGAAPVIAGFHAGLVDGIHAGHHGRNSPPPRLLVWDWGWDEAWVEEIVRRLPAEVSLMSVSEWNLPIRRGGVATAVGEYSISSIGPGPRATRHWALARQRGLRTMAKIQAGNTWELSAVPYIPAVANVAQHAANLRTTGVNGLMLGWSLGGYPSPNLEVVAEMGTRDPHTGAATATPEAAMARVAGRRFGPRLAPAFVEAWRAFSTAFSEFPFHGGVVYNAPMQFGPSNLLWSEPTGYAATMVGFPYDDLNAWRQVYPAEVFIGQFEKMADGFATALATLQAAVAAGDPGPSAAQRRECGRELSVAEAAALHFRSVANQSRFVVARQALGGARSAAEAAPSLAVLETVLRSELEVARRLHALQRADSRLGFEASNQYYYIPADLAEKALNCQDLLERWLPAQQTRWK